MQEGTSPYVTAADWKKLAKHPDLEAAHEALLLREAFYELLRTEEVQNQPERFRQLMREAESTSKELEATLRSQEVEGVAPSKESAGQVFTRVTNNCQACHKEFRDVPLGEKSLK